MNSCVILKNMAAEVSRTWEVVIDDGDPLYFADLRVAADYLKSLIDKGEVVR